MPSDLIEVIPVFPRENARRLPRSCSNKKIERDDEFEEKSSHSDRWSYPAHYGETCRLCYETTLDCEGEGPGVVEVHMGAALPSWLRRKDDFPVKSPTVLNLNKT